MQVQCAMCNGDIALLNDGMPWLTWHRYYRDRDPWIPSLCLIIVMGLWILQDNWDWFHLITIINYWRLDARPDMCNADMESSSLLTSILQINGFHSSRGIYLIGSILEYGRTPPPKYRKKNCQFTSINGFDINHFNEKPMNSDWELWYDWMWT